MMKQHRGPTLPIIDSLDYTSTQINALLIYLYTSRVISDNLSGPELQKILQESKSRAPPDSSTSLPTILSSDMSQLLEWNVTKNNEDAESDGSSRLMMNSLPIAGQWSDVKFLVGDKEIRAHKAILCANSEYFR